MAQALGGAIVDVVLIIGQANRVISYPRALTQSLADRLNSSGFGVQQIDDSNTALFSGGSMKLRVEIRSNGYASERDAASVVAGIASGLGYNVHSFSGALVQPGGSAVTYRENALDRDTTTGWPSAREAIPEVPLDLDLGQYATLAIFGLAIYLGVKILRG